VVSSYSSGPISTALDNPSVLMDSPHCSFDIQSKLNASAKYVDVRVASSI
jgi:hypothetical protein